MSLHAVERRLQGDSPTSVSETLRSPGRPLDAPTRTFMELRFPRDFSGVPARPATVPRGGMTLALDGPSERQAEAVADLVSSPSSRSAHAGSRAAPDFSRVRIHDDAPAARSAVAVGALAYTVGEHIAFGPRAYAPRRPEGKWLLAHELAHVLQGPARVLARAVAARYGTIRSNLTYSPIDWVITDEEAREVLTILAALAPADLADTVQEMERDGLVDRLLENVAEADRIAFPSLIQSIHRLRATTATAGFIDRLMSYGLLDWAITDEDAHLALEALKSLEPTPDRLKAVAARIPRNQFERFYDNLSPRDRSANLRFLQDLEMIRSSGVTSAELSAGQRVHLESKALAAGVSVGTFIRGESAARGYGGNPVLWWPPLPPAVKAAWVTRFTAVVANIKARAPQEVRQVILSAETAGGGIRWEPERTEELGAYAYNDGQHGLAVGKDWLERAENDPRDVFDNIMHELAGHQEFGATAAWDVMQGTLASIPPAERAIAVGGPRRPYSAYGYMETEIYAELREFEYRRPDSGGDDPSVDGVRKELVKIKEAFAPAVAEAIVRGLRRRVQLDDRIIPGARSLLDREIERVFAITF